MNISQSRRSGRSAMLFATGMAGMILFGCVENATEPLLSEPTSVGANTFSCRIDGKVWNAQTDPLTVATPIICNYRNDRPVLDVYAIRTVGSVSERVHFVCDTVRAPGRYRASLTSHIVYHGDSATIHDVQAGEAFIDVRALDTTRRIVAGTFEFNIRQDNGGTTIISDGRFDIQYP